MPRRIICWEITDAFSKFGFDDGDGPNFTDEVAAAIEAAGPYRCRTQIWGPHNYGIEAIEEEVSPEEWVRVAEFDGYERPPWESVPNARLRWPRHRGHASRGRPRARHRVGPQARETRRA